MYVETLQFYVFVSNDKEYEETMKLLKPKVDECGIIKSDDSTYKSERLLKFSVDVDITNFDRVGDVIYIDTNGGFNSDLMKAFCMAIDSGYTVLSVSDLNKAIANKANNFYDTYHFLASKIYWKLFSCFCKKIIDTETFNQNNSIFEKSIVCDVARFIEEYDFAGKTFQVDHRLTSLYDYANRNSKRYIKLMDEYCSFYEHYITIVYSVFEDYKKAMYILF